MGVAASFESHVIQIIHLSLKENARILMRVDIAVVQSTALRGERKVTRCLKC
mgnify:CR=1 FL=1